MFNETFNSLLKEVQTIKNELEKNTKRINQYQSYCTEGGSPADLKIKFAEPQLSKAIEEDRRSHQKTVEKNIWEAATKNVINSRLMLFMELQHKLNNDLVKYNNYEYILLRVKEICTRLNDTDLNQTTRNYYDIELKNNYEQFLFKIKMKEIKETPILKKSNVMINETQTKDIESRLMDLEKANLQLKEQLKNMKGAGLGVAKLGSDDLTENSKKKNYNFVKRRKAFDKWNSQNAQKRVPKNSGGQEKENNNHRKRKQINWNGKSSKY